MGVTYKIKSEVIEFIINKKKENPDLSCRKFSDLIVGQLKIKVSKSSINAIVKEAGLSMPIGRRQLKPRSPSIKLQLILPNLDLDLTPKLELTKKEEKSLPAIVEHKPIEQKEVAKAEPIKFLELPITEVIKVTPPIEKEKVIEKKEEVLRLSLPVEEKIPPQKLNVPQSIEIKLFEKTETPVKPVVIEGTKVTPPIEKEKVIEKKEEAPKLSLPVEKSIPLEKLNIPQAIEIKLFDKNEIPAKPPTIEGEKVTQPVEQQEDAKVKIVKPVSQETAPVLESILNKASETIIGDQTTGAIILKAADFLIGGVSKINEILSNHLGQPSSDTFSKVEALLYASLFDNPPQVNFAPNSKLWPLISRKFESDELSLFLAKLKDIFDLPKEIASALPGLFNEVRGIKLVLTNSECIYLDGELRTIWSTPNIPHYFSATTHETSSYVGNYLQGDSPLVLCMAPGYVAPAVEFFNFISSFDLQDEKSFSSFSTFGSHFEEFSSVKLDSNKKRYFIFGLWPWQFVDYRKINKIGEFKPFFFAPLNTEFRIADIELDLVQPVNKKAITLRGYALKTDPNEKIKLAILSNYPANNFSEDLCRTYLNHWPNFDNSFVNFNNKVEFFTHNINSQHSLLTENLDFNSFIVDIDSALTGYLKALNLFVKRHFLPSGCESRNPLTMKEQFFDLEVSIRNQGDVCVALFSTPKGYALLSELKYLCSRLNEKNISLFNGKKIWFDC